MIEPVKDTLVRLATQAHAAVFTRTDGRIGGNAFGMTSVKLTTTGRKTGKPRTTMVSAPVYDDDTVVLVASYGGDPRNPAWLLNLRDNPDVEIVMKGRRRRMRARVATPEEKAELWPKVTAAYKGYAFYQRRTSRDIPLVILQSST